MPEEPQRFTIWHGLFLAEGAAVMIALLMPITPSKTGSVRGLPHLLLPEPTYVQEVLIYFALTNLLLVLLGAVLALWVRGRRSSGAS